MSSPGDLNVILSYFFEYDRNNNTTSCKVSECNKIFKANVKCKYTLFRVFSVVQNLIILANLKRHLVNCHKKIAAEHKLCSIDDNEIESGNSSNVEKVQTIKIKMNSKIFVKACVGLTTINSLPYNIFNYEFIKDIFGPIEDALNIKITDRNIVDRIEIAYNQIVKEISNLLKDRMVSLKMDSATRKDRTILGNKYQINF